MIENFKPHIGKTVIETLTMGMYEDPRIIYREYIQNAADQIDIAYEERILKKMADGKIIITIDPKKRSIEIHDNATGISNESVLHFLGDIANSEKDQSERKGFRGIGRLGGLGYCERLIFKTSARGESKLSIMTLDAKLLRSMLLDRTNVMDAATVISIITNLEEKKEAPDKHYFTVTLENVRNDALLNIEEVTKYLTMVAPVPFKKSFKYSEEIKKYLNKRNLFLDEYHILLNKKELYKRYQNEIEDEDEQVSEILGIEYFEVRTTSKKLLAVGWLGYREKSNFVLGDNVVEKCLRLRKDNIQIGGELTLSKFFKPARSNLRFIGEVHVIGAEFIPNARRDYFIDNATCQSFEARLREAIKKGNYENEIAHNASKISTRVATIEKYDEERKKFESAKFRSPAEEQVKRAALSTIKSKAVKAAKDLEALKKKTKKNRKVDNLFKKLTENKSLDIIEGITLSKNIYDPPKFRKLNESQKAIVLEIFEIIERELDVDEAESLKIKIIEHFN